MAKEQAKRVIAVKSVLTPEQVAKAHEEMKKMFESRGDRGPRREGKGPREFKGPRKGPHGEKGPKDGPKEAATLPLLRLKPSKATWKRIASSSLPIRAGGMSSPSRRL